MSYDIHQATLFHYWKQAVWKELGDFLLCASENSIETLPLLQPPSTPLKIVIFVHGLQPKGNSFCGTMFYDNHDHNISILLTITMIFLTDLCSVR